MKRRSYVSAILEAVADAVARVDELNGRVTLARGYPTNNPPAVNVRSEGDEDVGVYSNELVDAVADVALLITVQGDPESLDSEFHDLAALIGERVFADSGRALGLPFVWDTQRQRSSIDGNAEGEQGTASGLSRWRIYFRRPEDQFFTEE